MREGADPEQLDQLAVRFNSAAGRIDGQMQTLHRLSREAAWHGVDAREFLTLLEGDVRIRLNHGVSRLREAATELRRQADEQRHASEAVGGGPTGDGNGRQGGPRGPLDFGPFAHFLGGVGWPWSALGPVVGLASAAQLAALLGPLVPGGPIVVGGGALAYGAGLLWPHGEARVAPWTGDNPANPGAPYHHRADSFGNYLDEMRDLHDGEIEIRHIDGSHPPRYVVLLKGVDDLANPDSPGSVTDLNAALIERMQRDGRWSRAVEHALDQAHLPSDAQVMLIGHSGGGIVAANLAGNDDFLRKYHVTHVLTNGSGVTDKLAHVNSGVHVLMLDHDTDIVSRTIQSVARPDAGNGSDHLARVFSDTTPRGGAADHGSGHHYDYYSNYLDTTGDPAVRSWLDSAAAYRGEGTAQFFKMSD